VHFRNGRWNGRRTRFHDKRRHAIGMHVSLLSQKRARLGYKLNRDTLKRRSSPLYPRPSQFRSSMMWARLVYPDQRLSHLRVSPIIVSDLSFLHTSRPHHVA
jgi:hypothetical protein